MAEAEDLRIRVDVERLPAVVDFAHRIADLQDRLCSGCTDLFRREIRDWLDANPVEGGGEADQSGEVSPQKRN
jgi:hypothetical protein